MVRGASDGRIVRTGAGQHWSSVGVGIPQAVEHRGGTLLCRSRGQCKELDCSRACLVQEQQQEDSEVPLRLRLRHDSCGR